jgi:hypothetical protein
LKPPLQLSLQLADGRHRAELPRHRVARWVRAALAAPGQITVRIVDVRRKGARSIAITAARTTPPMC